MDYALSSKLRIESTPSSNEVRFIKKQYNGKTRYIRLPIALIRSVSERASMIINQKENINQDNWEVQKVNYMDSDYISFTHKDSCGNRVG